MAVTNDDIKQIFTNISTHFEPSKAQGINSTIQFDLSGDAGGAYWLRINDDAMETGEGIAENARMTLKASADDFAAMLDGSLNPMQAFMMGKIKIQGDTGLAMKLMPLMMG